MNSYIAQAQKFLNESNTTCEIVFQSCQNKNFVGKLAKHNVYQITLKNSKGFAYSFDFTDSIHNTEKRIKPSCYDILACLNTYDETFDDFCADFGYTFETEKEFIKVKQVYLDVIEQSENLKKLFTCEQLEQLQEIN